MTATLPTSTKPLLQSLFAPSALVELLDTPLAAGPQAGQSLEADVAADIQRIEVTHVHTGISSYSLTVNNWHTAEDYGAAKGSSPGAPSRFKYNDMSVFGFDKRLRIWMRYWPDQSEAASRVSGLVETWTPLISGPITDVQYSFGERNEVVIKGEDDMSRLKDKRQDRFEFPAKSSDMDIVRRVLALAKYPLTAVAAPRVELPAFATQPAQGATEGMQDGQSYLEYLNKLAEKLDCEVFVEFDRLSATPTSPPGLTFHFEPARSKARYDDPAGATFELRRGQTVLSFSPTLKVDAQPTSVAVRGRHRDRSRAERVDETNDDIQNLLRDELQYDPGLGDAEPQAGPVVRQTLMRDRDNRMTLTNQPNTDSQRATAIANAEVCRKAREFLTATITTVGVPRIRAGNYVEVRGFDAPFDGFYYVTEAKHTLDASGMRTSLKVRRPGMALTKGKTP